ncbi:MAG: FtsQ-type POTRA domain-containing protein [Clostridia bacterium]|nr:FtsQ-type POTRA domain-containing protein [Clostridia bacterium]
MTKKSIIWLAIFVTLIALIGILFGAVFCLRNQNVKVVDGSALLVDKSEIIQTAGFKNGKSIFMIDKDKAISNIEAKYPHIKVVQIKTTGLLSIEISVRTRHEMYYTEANEKYYVLDEDLKVLNIIEETTSESEPTNLTKIVAGEISISTTTEVCDFVGTNHQRLVAYDLFVAMNTVVTKTDGETETYLDREDIKSMLKTVDFEEFDTFNKLIITTKYGVKLDIEKPENNLQNKINICFSTIETFLASTETENKEQSGTIKIYYNLNNEMQCIYIPQTEVNE